MLTCMRYILSCVYSCACNTSFRSLTILAYIEEARRGTIRQQCKFHNISSTLVNGIDASVSIYVCFDKTRAHTINAHVRVLLS